MARLRHRLPHRPARLLLPLLVALAMLSGLQNPAGAVTYAAITGTGSTWSANMINIWIAAVNSSGIQVTYTANGSTTGRQNFASYQNDFGVTEIPYQGAHGERGADTSGGRAFAYMPIVAGGTSLAYQIRVGGKLVTNLRLSGETLTKIFTGQITNWDDAAITKDNNGRKLPSLKIQPVVRSDGSGTTAQFTLYMKTEYPSLWHWGETSFFPASKLRNSIAQSGSDQVINTITAASGNGTIGYVEYSYALNKKYPVVKLLNKAGYFTAPTATNVAVALTQATFNHDGTQNLGGVYANADKRAYPMSSYSYLLLPTGAKDKTMTTAKRQTLADFLTYAICSGQAPAANYGYSPLPYNLVKYGFSKIALLKTADRNVNLANHDISKCDNPAFSAKGSLAVNHLAQTAPYPATCDQVGHGPCGDTTSTGTGDNNGNNGNGGSGGGSTAAGNGTGGNGGSADPANPSSGDSANGASGDTTTASGTGSEAVPLDLASSRAGDRTAFGIVASAELLAVILLPGALALWFRRRRRDGKADA